jgi:hypothetical protein
MGAIRARHALAAAGAAILFLGLAGCQQHDQQALDRTLDRAEQGHGLEGKVEGLAVYIGDTFADTEHTLVRTQRDDALEVAAAPTF